MALIDNGHCIQDADMNLRVAMAIIKTADYVLSEPPETENHESRLAMAESIITMQDATMWASRFMPKVANNVTIANHYASAVAAENPHPGLAAPDSDVEYVVSMFWDDFALRFFPQE